MSHAPPYRIAAVMIARNEAPRIAAALASVRPHVDELVVLDTGSSDDTLAIAASAGARCASWCWRDDFAAARNAALSLASADWHLVIDADETLADGQQSLHALRQQAPNQVWQVQVRNQQAQGEPLVSSWISRILPAGVRYVGRVHEQPDHQWPVRRSPLVLAHSGYEAQALARKAGRNARLLAHALADDPTNAYLHYQTGKDHDVYGRWAQALAAFDHAQALLPAQQPAPAWLHDLAVRRIHACAQLGQWRTGMAHADAACQRWPDSPDAWFATGDLALAWAAQAPEHLNTLLPLAHSAWQHCLRIGERPDLEGAVHGRGSTLAGHNLKLLETWASAQQHRSHIPA